MGTCSNQVPLPRNRLERRMQTNLASKVDARYEQARLTTDALAAAKSTVSPKYHDEIDALRLRLLACNNPMNWFVADEAVNYETGEVYQAHGTLWNCNSKLCTNCVARRSAAKRRQVREALQRQEMTKGERFYFVTYTIKNPNLSLAATRALVNRAWCLFRKRSLCVDLIRGGVKSEEFTLTRNGYHYHLHCIYRSRWLLYGELRRTWTECVATAFEEAELELLLDSPTHTLSVNFQMIYHFDRAVNEVCKYITKSDSWAKLRPDQLAEVALVRRWHRMFEMFGSFSNRGEIDEQSEVDDDSTLGYLDTTPLSDGSESPSPRYWRDILAGTTLANYKLILFAEIEQARDFRTRQIAFRWPQATVKFLNQ